MADRYGDTVERISASATPVIGSGTTLYGFGVEVWLGVFGLLLTMFFGFIGWYYKKRADARDQERLEIIKRGNDRLGSVDEK